MRFSTIIAIALYIIGILASWAFVRSADTTLPEDDGIIWNETISRRLKKCR